MQNRREVSFWRCGTAGNSLHLHQQNRLRFNNSKNCFFSQRMNNHIIRLSSLRFLVVAFFVVRAEFQAPLSVAWKAKNAPRRDVEGITSIGA